MKKTRTLWIAVLLLGGLAAAAFYQARSTPAQHSLSEMMPAGPLLYLEGKDFSSLVRDWNASPEKRAWLKSDNYEVFSRSRLFLRLQQAQQEFAAAAGLPPDMDMLQQVAGSDSALALYDIGKLEFLYITRMPAAHAMESALWQKRGDFEPRNVAGAAYYLRTDPQSGRVVAFGVAGDYLVLATREDLIAGAISLISGQAGRTVASESWFDQATRAAGEPGDLRLVLNMTAVVKAPHFRTYWIQRNITELKQYSAAISDLRRSSAEYREERVLVRAKPAAADENALKDGESAVAELLRLAPDDAGVYLAWAAPSAEQATRLVQQKILAPHLAAPPPSQTAPGVALSSGETGSAADLETRIDEPPLANAAGKLGPEALGKLFAGAGLRAAMQVESTRKLPDGVFVGGQSAVILLASSEWNESAVGDALSSAVQSVWTTSGLGVRWTPSGTGAAAFRSSDGLIPMCVAARGKLLVIAGSSEAMQEVLARLSAKPAAEGATYAAGFRHARERENFARMTRLIDQPRMPAPSPGQPSEHEPQFFSENVASLSRALAAVESESIVVHDRGATVAQTVTYRFAK